MDSLLNTPSFSSEPITKNQQSSPFPHEKQQMMSVSGDRRVSKLDKRPPEPEQLPCPRCNSTSTKFCYYNNYNLSQPRHFCKSCRRYWTRGGALRNIPVGGGTRKAASSNKRSRVATTPTTGGNCNVLASSSDDSNRTGQNQSSDPVVSSPAPGLVSGSLTGDADTLKSGSLNSWWTGQIGFGTGPVLPLYGHGFGHGPGYGIGGLDWPMDPVGGEDDGGVLVPGNSTGFNTWQMVSGSEDGLVKADYFSLPDLAISAPAKALK